ncbi:hypothetical protein BFL36_09640 [Clavibacter michiganensis]|uniref:DUF3027 domain-containing protein n=1 Tax=Clavibacter michiganensis TaxID=28447 RepID=A0A251YER4_9MICO|nr:DUF3027 domain-containing protein [Clavibacter michiganensis]OUE22735.1 hypothetical protein BFL36_09640 [Clavibacter michiganensis]
MPDRVDDETVEETMPGDVSEVTPPVTADAVADADGAGDAPDAVVEEPAAPAVPDAELLAAVDLARAALLEITPADTVGDPAGSTIEGDRVLSLLFANTMAGYPGWYWTVTLARVDDAAPTVLEAELMPGEGALLSPEWLPWSDRLAGMEADEEAERLAAESGSDDDYDDESDDDDDESDDASDDDAEDADDVLDGVDFESAPAPDGDDGDDDDDTSFDGADR